ncbi:hypothetical protein [Peribacillus deserti]|uniref:Carboxypeptidase regulatory-like domain-containing protein n=1 Tax=Peribacillus deserti TaxID=673318 RepID=A0A2N5MBP1_9BACI|nr:hypothetical protein [Peribacillus deserti]PLT31766.1 hypothetical protein CUU66_00980 [Peribacillus deserti]
MKEKEGKKMGKRVIFLVMMVVLFSGVFGSRFGQAQAKPRQETSTEVTVKEGSNKLRNTMLLIKSKEKNSKMKVVVTDAKGAFKERLSDGSYSVKAIKPEHNGAWYTSSSTFSVKGGKVSGFNNNDVHVSKGSKIESAPKNSDITLNGVLMDGRGLKGDLVIARYTDEYEEEPFIVSASNKGEFSASLSDGTYYIFGVQFADGFYRYDMNFSIEGKELYVNGEKKSSLNVTLPENSYTLSVHDTSNPLANAELVLEKVVDEAEGYTEFIQYVTTTKKGEASLRKLQDGLYSLGVYHQTFSSWQALTFEVLDGKLVVDGKRVSILDIAVPDINLTGIVTSESKSVGNAGLEILAFNENGEAADWYYVAADDKGRLQFRLADGSYQVISVYENNRNSHTDIKFEIENGRLLQDGAVQTSLKVDLPPVTFSGKLLEGGRVLEGSAEIETVSEDGKYAWYSASTDENGILSLRLLDGQYRVNYINLYEDGESMPYSAEFEIRDGKLYVDGVQKESLDLQVPPVTLNGMVFDGDVPLAGGEAAVHSTDPEYYNWKPINPDGSFTMRLPDGDYVLEQVYANDRTMALVKKEFTILEGKLYIDGVLSERLEIKLPPVNVTGVLNENGSQVDGDVNIRTVSETGETTHLWATTYEDGQFNFRLPDGKYEVFYIYLYDGTTDQTVRSFTIESGQLFVNGERADTLSIDIAPVTVTGTVRNGEDLITEGYVSVTALGENAEQKWYSSEIFHDGTYKFRLADGNYELRFVDTYTASYSFNKPFTIESEKIVVDGEEVQFLDINLEDAGQGGVEGEA